MSKSYDFGTIGVDQYSTAAILLVWTLIMFIAILGPNSSLLQRSWTTSAWNGIWVEDLLVEDLNKADHAMKDNADMVGKLHDRKLCTVFENRILFSTGRLENMMKHILEKRKSWPS